MKNRICFKLATSFICIVILTACVFDNGERGDVWVTAEFSIDKLSRNSSEALYAVSGTETSLIVAVPASVNSVTTDSYLPANFDRQLLNLANNTVSLSIPLNTPMRLIKANFDQLLPLSQIASTQPTALQTGISSSFSVSINDGTKAISIAMDQNASLSPFYANGVNWNDYIKNDGIDVYSAGDIACVGDETSDSYDACIHAGEMRTFTVTGSESCTGLTATDSLGAFEWNCISGSPDVRFVSAGFSSDKSLSDLINFTTTPPTWKSLTVTVMESGSAVLTAGTSAWADNTIIVNNNGGSLTTEGVIYAVTSDPATSFTIDSNKVALVVEPGLTISGDNSTYSLIEADTMRFIWIEGSFDGSNNDSGILLTSTWYSVLRNVAISNANGLASLSDAGLKLSISRHNIIENITTGNGMGIGVFMSSSHYNRMRSITSTHNKDRGIVFNNSGNNRLMDIKSLYNRGLGIYLYSTWSINNRFDGLLLVGNWGGLNMWSPGDNSFTGVVVANNSDHGLYVSYSSNNYFGNVTVANNGAEGVYVSQAASPTPPENNTLNSCVTVNNDLGTFLDRLDNTIVHNLVSVSNTTYGVNSNIADNGSYTGVLKVGNNTTADCIEAGGTLPGIDGACASSAALTTGVSMASSFPGKITTDDATNDSDASGQATYPTDFSTFDFTGFENDFRAWGIENVAGFPDTTHQGRFGCSVSTAATDIEADCLAAPGTWIDTGRIWDWSVASIDSVILNVLSLPTGNDTLIHTWSDATTTQYLKNAVELMFDGIGDDDILCESGETCLFTPNIGAYQGHGNLISAGAFTDGTLTSITLMKYENNGR